MAGEEAEEPPVAPKRRLGLFRRREPQAEEPPPPAPPRHVRLLPRRPAEEEEEPSAAEQEVAELFGAGGSPADEREDGQQ